MPLTFPSHAAAVLPLLHLPGTRRLPPAALVIGSAAPDLIYLVGTLGAAAHHPRGLLVVCLPAGLLAFVCLEALLLPVLAPLLLTLSPQRARPTLARLLGPRPLPHGLLGWSAVCVAIVLGAATHQLWDGFTHAWMWPARALYPTTTLSLFGHPVLLSRIFQHGSSLLGLIVVCVYLRRTAPPRVEPTVQPHAARTLLAIMILPLIAGMLAATLNLRVPDPLITRALWNAAWSALAWSLLALAIVCSVVRALARTPRR